METKKQVAMPQAQMAQLSRPFLASNIPQRTGNTHQSPVSFAQCGRCRIYHPPTASCPSLRTPAQISIALDDIKFLSGGDPVAKQLNKGILQQILRDAKNGRQAGQNSSSPAPTPQPVQALQPSQQRTVQQPQAKPALPSIQLQVAPKPVQLPPKPVQQQPQLSAAAEEDSDESSTNSDADESEAESEDESEAESGAGSDAGSDAGSEAGSGSSGSESGKDVLAEILSR